MKTLQIALTLSVAFGLAIAQSAANAETLNADVFALKNPGDALFHYQREGAGLPGKHTENGVYHDAKGEVAVEEKVDFGDQGEVLSYLLKQKQIDAVGELTVKDGKVQFSYTKDGKTKTSTEDAPKNLIVGPSLVSFLQKNWDKLKNGESLSARYASLDRRETIGFTFKKMEELTENGQKIYRIRMSPSSLIISALVNPLQFFLKEDGSKLMRFEGRTLLKIKVDGDWKDLDAKTIYH